MELALIILAVLLLVLLNGALAMSEIAVVSSDRTRLQHLREAGNEGAEAALELKRTPNRFLSAVQIGITLVGIVAGAFGQATLSRKLAGALAATPVPAGYRDALASGIVILLITYVTLVLGELVPKRLGMQSPERIAAGIARPMSWLSRITAPLVTFLSASTEAVLRLLGRAGQRETPMSEAEIRAKILEGAEQGVLERAESDLAANVLRMDDERVSAIMRPRSEVAWIDLTASPDPEQIRSLLAEQPISGVPVARGSLDRVVGVLNVREWLTEGDTENLVSLLQEPLLVYEGISSLEVLERFRQHRTHLALVVDEYGSVQGAVTLEDVLEGIVGHVPAAARPPDPEVVQREDGSWLLDGLLPVERLQELLSRDVRREGDLAGYYSIGGFVMARLGRVPGVGDSFRWEGWCFEVVDMDGSRVDRILVRQEAPERRAA